MAVEHFSLKEQNIKIKTVKGKSVVCGKCPSSFDGSFSISQSSLNVNVPKAFVFSLWSLCKHSLENLWPIQGFITMDIQSNSKLFSLALTSLLSSNTVFKMFVYLVLLFYSYLLYTYHVLSML